MGQEFASGFCRISEGRPFSKFPPIIGATDGTAEILFVGINPRVGASNCSLYWQIMPKFEDFIDLGKNRTNGQVYIGLGAKEQHYRVHWEIVSAIFAGAAFEAVAAVTELYFCASGDSKIFHPGFSPCADSYFENVVELVQPKVIVALGQLVHAYFEARYAATGLQATILAAGQQRTLIKLAHPRAKGSINVHAAVTAIAAVLGVSLGPATGSTPQTQGSGLSAQRFALNPAFAYAPHRSGTAIFGIVTSLQALNGPFTYPQFEQIVARVLGWHATSSSFSVQTEFRTLPEATNAWLHELLKKRRPIVIKL